MGWLLAAVAAVVWCRGGTSLPSKGGGLLGHFRLTLLDYMNGYFWPRLASSSSSSSGGGGGGSATVVVE